MIFRSFLCIFAVFFDAFADFFMLYVILHDDFKNYSKVVWLVPDFKHVFEDLLLLVHFSYDLSVIVLEFLQVLHIFTIFFHIFFYLTSYFPMLSQNGIYFFPHIAIFGRSLSQWSLMCAICPSLLCIFAVFSVFCRFFMFHVILRYNLRNYSKFV
jgi:hypothetical protein